MAARPGPSIATHHLDLSDLTLDQALALLDQREFDPHYPDRIFKLSLLAVGDEVVEGLVNWLNQDTRKVVHHPWVRRALLVRRDAEEAQSYSGDAGPSIQTSRLPLRIISLTNHKVEQSGYDALARLIAMHGSLTTLDLTLNTLYKQPLQSLRLFSSGVSQSLLRKLVLSDTKLSVDAFCELIDNLDAPCLHELRLSLTLPGRESIKRQDSQRATLSIARLLRVPAKEDRSSGSRSRQGHELNQPDADVDVDVDNAARSTSGRAPQLEVLTLNGNPLTLPGVKMIVAAAIGGPASTPNRVLTHVELFYTCESDERDADDDEAQESSDGRRGGPTGDPNGGQRRTLSISRGYRAAKQAAVGSINNGIAHSAAGELLGPPRRPNDADGEGKHSDHYGENSSRAYYEPNDPRAYAHVTAENWRRLLGAHLWHNTRQRSSVVHAAQQVLGKARVLGCTSSCRTPSAATDKRNAQAPIPPPSTSSTPVVSLGCLPPELRLAILREVDASRALSEEQFRRIVSWACDRSTIGYGSPGVDPPWSHRDTDWEQDPEQVQIEHSQSHTPFVATGPSTCLLPTTPWCWKDMLTRSLPRDWTAEAWDLWNEHKDLIPLTGGGGGGPDGQGGATEILHSRRRRGRGRGVSVAGDGEGTGTVAAFPTTSLDHTAPQPALLAFLEATGTRAWQD